MCLLACLVDVLFLLVRLLRCSCDFACLFVCLIVRVVLVCGVGLMCCCFVVLSFYVLLVLC